jgi:hypothetical protein
MGRGFECKLIQNRHREHWRIYGLGIKQMEKTWQSLKDLTARFFNYLLQIERADFSIANEKPSFQLCNLYERNSTSGLAVLSLLFREKLSSVICTFLTTHK